MVIIINIVLIVARLWMKRYKMINDYFECNNCKIKLEKSKQIIVEPCFIGFDKLVYKDFNFKFCPNCGKKVER